MKQPWILPGLVLTVAVLTSSPPVASAAHPLDGKVFQSVERLPGGERRDGTVNLIHWTIRFTGKEFTWRRTDVVSPGTYEFDARTGAVLVKGSNLKASFDAKTGVLTWDRRKYVEVK